MSFVWCICSFINLHVFRLWCPSRVLFVLSCDVHHESYLFWVAMSVTSPIFVSWGRIMFMSFVFIYLMRITDDARVHYNNLTGATEGGRTKYSAGSHEFTPVFNRFLFLFLCCLIFSFRCSFCPPLFLLYVLFLKDVRLLLNIYAFKCVLITMEKLWVWIPLMAKCTR